jgi:hypothetical protein
MDECGGNDLQALPQLDTEVRAICCFLLAP